MPPTNFLTRHIHRRRPEDLAVRPDDCTRCRFVWNVMVRYSYRFCGPVSYPSGGKA